MTADLAGFLRARLDEDEQAARDAATSTCERWKASGGSVVGTTSDHPGEVAIGPWSGELGAAGIHIARHDPKRVLAEVDTRRRILDRYISAVADSVEDADGYYDETRFEDARQLYPVLRLLALPYAAHPDYRPEWAPE